jgi:hypothetical protein
MCDRHDLSALREPLQCLGDTVRGLSSDTRVDLVEHHRLTARNRRDREGYARQLPAGGCFGNGRERQAAVGSDQEHDLIGARGPGLAFPQLRDELAFVEPDSDQLRRNCCCESRGRFVSCVMQLVAQSQRRLRGCRKCFGRHCCGIHALVDRVELGACLSRACEQLVVGLDAKTSLRVGDAIEPCFDLFETAGLRFERGQESSELARRLPQAQLGVSQFVAGAGELRRESLER